MESERSRQENTESKAEKRMKLTDREEELLIEQMKYIQSEVVSIQQGFLGVISIPLGIYALILYYTLTVKNNATLKLKKAQ